LSEYEKDHEEGTTDTVTMYFKAHLVPFFGDAEHITKESAQDYARERLTTTTRATVRKELSALRIFTSWAGLDVEIPGLPKYGHPGKRHPHARKEMATIVRAKDMDKILAKMPDRAPRGGHWVRPFFRLLWETALRPSTLFRLQAGKHYRKGDRELFITRDIDKGHAERRIPLSLPSRKALDQCVPEVGSIFATFSLREPLLRACEASQVKVPSLAPYDLKSSRLTAWANTPGIPLPGVQYLAGHASLATTAKYVVAQKEAAELVILGRIVGKKRAPKS
jgi:site-specific recombinase XerD